MKIGIDIFEISRLLEKPIEKNHTLYNKIFSSSELSYCTKFSNPYPHLAGIFAAKEAIIKSLDELILLSDICLTWDKQNKPIVNIRSKKSLIEISISHSKNNAVAVSINLI